MHELGKVKSYWRREAPIQYDRCPHKKRGDTVREDGHVKTSEAEIRQMQLQVKDSLGPPEA